MRASEVGSDDALGDARALGAVEGMAVRRDGVLESIADLPKVRACGGEKAPAALRVLEAGVLGPFALATCTHNVGLLGAEIEEERKERREEFGQEIALRPVFTHVLCGDGQDLTKSESFAKQKASRDEVFCKVENDVELVVSIGPFENLGPKAVQGLVFVGEAGCLDVDAPLRKAEEQFDGNRAHEW